jgi:cell division protein FtsB
MAPPRRRPARSTLLLRWLAVAVLAVIAVSYVQPLRSYQAARSEADRKQAEVTALEREKRALDARLASARTDQFVEREARKLGLVRPGELLFIVSAN